MLQRHILYVAKTKFICCKDKIYMLQRQNLHVIKTNLYVTERSMYVIKIKLCVIKTKLYDIQTKFLCYKDKIYMLQRQKSSVLGLSAPAGAFFSQKKTLLFFENTI